MPLLKPGVTKAQANQALQPLLEEFARQMPKRFPKQFRVQVKGLNDWVVERPGRYPVLTAGGSGVVTFLKKPYRLAQLSICVLFLALIRTLAEFFRLKHILGSALHIATIAPYVSSALFTALGTWTAVLCYFAGRNRTAVSVAAVTILALFILKLVVIGP
jgi:hypothetical protein